MSLTIWHELDIPRHPLTAEEETAILGAAQETKLLLEGHLDTSWLDLLARETKLQTSWPMSGSRERFIGRAIGGYAHLKGHSVTDRGDTGFRVVDVEEITNLRLAKAAGIRAVENTEQSFNDLLATAVSETQQGPRIHDHPANIVGYAIGARYEELNAAALSGVAS